MADRLAKKLQLCAADLEYYACYCPARQFPGGHQPDCRGPKVARKYRLAQERALKTLGYLDTLV